MQNVQIVGTAGAALVDPGGSPASFGAVLEIDNSQNITVQDLTIQVASRTIDFQIAVVSISASNVTFRTVRIEGAGPSDGIDILQSTVRLFGATVVENNNDGEGLGEGIFVQGPDANLTLRRDPAGNCPVIQGNGGDGIFVNGSGAHVGIPASNGCATIQNNGGTGIFASQGATVGLSALQATPGTVQVLNNTYGVIATLGSQLNVNGPVLIQGNTVIGLRLRTAFGSLGSAADGAAGPTIRQNGSASSNPSTVPCCAPPAAISLSNNATLDISAALVTGNSAPGLLVQDNSSVRLIGFSPIVITQNLVGISVTNTSTAALFLVPSVAGNAGFDLVCGPESVAYGDLSGVGKTSCQQFKQQPNQGQPPKKRSRPLP
jgi:hypothetical protein